MVSKLGNLPGLVMNAIAQKVLEVPRYVCEKAQGQKIRLGTSLNSILASKVLILSVHSDRISQWKLRFAPRTLSS